MTRHFASSLVALLALAAAPGATAARTVPATLAILVGGVQQPTYWHDQRFYVEALKGREYAIRLRNPYGVRVAVALSVDGLNTIDARETTAKNARKWVLGPYETVTISGWQTSRSHARAFEFTTEERSYGQALGRTANLGIISAVFFRERPPQHSQRRDQEAREAAPTSPPPAAAQSGAGQAAADEYAATGMGRRTDHAVEQVRMDLEEAPASSVNIRYEFRPQLVRLGILPSPRHADPLTRREHARGFEPGFAPEID
jgi:hypothetical protein